jgi:hypothetical protein
MLTDKLFSPTSTAVGTVGPYRVDELRSSRLGRLLLKRLSKLIRIVAEQRETAGKRKGETVSELLLRAARYVGQANIDSNRQRSFVSYVVALETVLLPKITTELGYRLATRLSTLLTDDPKRWARLHSIVLGDYSTRSSIAHGVSVEIADMQLDQARMVSFSVLAHLLRSPRYWSLSDEAFGSALERQIAGRSRPRKK